MRPRYGVGSIRVVPRGVRVGGELDQAPHADEVWIPFGISTDDSLDYARWLNVRYSETWSRVTEHIVDPDPSGATVPDLAKQPPLVQQFVPLLLRWQEYAARLEESYWARVDSWDRIRQFHAELLDFAASGRAAGWQMPSAERLGVVPSSGTTAIADGIASGLGSLGSFGVGLGIAAAGVAALLLTRKAT